jgi:putative ABC transport system permease protein
MPLRFIDLLGLSLSALWQHKVRMILTTLGVVFGSLVLAISLSVREGVHETVSQQYQKYGELRLIDVHRNRFSRERKPPPDVVNVKGNMSAEKRQRLREELTDRWQRGFVPSEEEERGLPKDKVAAISKLEHVRSVKPWIHLFAHVSLGDKGEYADCTATTPDDSNLKEQLVAGDVFPAANSESVVVSEYLLYQLGVVDDEAVANILGKKVRLEFQGGGPSRFSVLSLFQVTGKDLAAAEQKVLDGIAARLPAAIAKMDLGPEEKELIQKLLAEKAVKAPPEPVLVTKDLIICGVLAAGEGKGKKGHSRFAWNYRGQDVILPIGVAEEIFFEFPQSKKQGFERVIVEVDHIDHVKEINETIKGMGMQSDTLIEYIEREQFTYLMIFTSMTVVALIALLVAALGITNTMLMSVLERVREIGIMKAVGARELHVRLIFLIEGGLIGLVGGLLGLLLAWGATFPADAWVKSMVERRLNIQLDHSIFAFPWWLVVGVPFFAWLVTTLAAYYPARRAARTDPIQALRHE